MLGLGNMQPGEVAAAHVEDLALLHQLFHRLPDLFPRRGPFNVVHLVEIDMIGLQTAQAVFAGFADVIGAKGRGR